MNQNPNFNVLWSLAMIQTIFKNRMDMNEISRISHPSKVESVSQYLADKDKLFEVLEADGMLGEILNLLVPEIGEKWAKELLHYMAMCSIYENSFPICKGLSEDPSYSLIEDERDITLAKGYLKNGLFSPDLTELFNEIDSFSKEKYIDHLLENRLFDELENFLNKE